MRGIYAIVALCVAILAASAGVLLKSGDSTQQLAFAALIIAPLALYLGLTRPLIFPFCVYVLLVPFDNLLGMGKFGTLTKLLGLVSSAFLALALFRRGAAAPLTRSTVLLGAVFAWMVLSVTWSLDQQQALASLLPYATIFAFYWILASIRPTALELKLVLATIVIGGVAAAVYGASSVTHAEYQWSQNAQRVVLATDQAHIDPNQFADSMLAPAALVAMWGLRNRRITIKAIAVACIALIGMAIVASGSREAFLAFALIFVYLAVRSPYRLQVIGTAALLSPALLAMPSSLWERFGTLISTGGSGRGAIFNVGVEAAKHQPIQGYGIGNFQNAYDRFYLGIHQTYPYGFDSPAHDLVLHYGVELGVIGLALLAWWLVTQWRALAAIPKENEWRDYATALEASLIGIVAVSFAIDLFTYKYAWLVFAAIAMLSNRARAQDQASADIRAATPAMMPARSAR